MHACMSMKKHSSDESSLSMACLPGSLRVRVSVKLLSPGLLMDGAVRKVGGVTSLVLIGSSCRALLWWRRASLIATNSSA